MHFCKSLKALIHFIPGKNPNVLTRVGYSSTKLKQLGAGLHSDGVGAIVSRVTASALKECGLQNTRVHQRHVGELKTVELPPARL